MKLNTITIRNVLGVQSVDIKADRPAVLVAGFNGAGKSSIVEAIKQAFTGEPGRGVDAKKDYKKLLHDDAEIGAATIEWGSGRASIVLPKGDRETDWGDVKGAEFIGLCIDPPAFARLDDKARRTTLFSLTGVRITPAAVRERLVKRGVDMARAERALPLLAAGFESAYSEAKTKARESKAAWKTATGGETWGKDKAEGWEPKPLEHDVETSKKLLDGARKAIELDEEDIGALQQQIGAAKASESARVENERKRADLELRAGKLNRFKEKLGCDEAELIAWQLKVDNTRALAGEAPAPSTSPDGTLLRALASVTSDFLALSCEYPDVQWDAGLLNRASIHVAEYKKRHGEIPKEGAQRDPEAAAKLPEYEKALELIRSSVANDKRDIADAERAAADLEAMDAPKGGAADLDGLNAKLREIIARRDTFRADEKKYAEIIRKAGERESMIAKAAELHADVLAWDEIGQAFAPDGIQSEFLAEAIGPFNATLRDLSELAEWPDVQIDDDMQITVGGRPYVFRSKSEKWRADSIIAASIAKTCGLRFVMLDEFDILDAGGRSEALYWLDDLIADGTLDSAILLGTMKSLPGALPENICAKWIDGGKIEEAA